jgi:hypothetical protein
MVSVLETTAFLAHQIKSAGLVCSRQRPEGPRKNSPGFSLGLDQNTAFSPVRARETQGGLQVPWRDVLDCPTLIPRPPGTPLDSDLKGLRSPAAAESARVINVQQRLSC